MTKEEQIQRLQREIMEGLKGKSCGEQRDIVVYINHAVATEYEIGLIQQIESAIDNALGHIGFSRSKTTKGDICELVYWQFAFAQRESRSVP